MKIEKLCFPALLALVALNSICQENRIFSLQNQADRTIPVDLSINKNTQLEIFESRTTLSGLAITGTISLFSDSSLVRLILVDEEDHEYLIYETYPVLAGIKQFSVAGVAEETSSLDQVIPLRVTVELVDASIHLTEIMVSEGGGPPEEIKSERLQQQSLNKIRRINENIRLLGQHWVAGETSISRLSYQEKKSMFGGSIPNFQGLEYYVGGVFVLPVAKQGDPNLKGTKSATAAPAESQYVKEYSWRNRHGEDWVTGVKKQLDCRSDWAFGAAAALELMMNLYFNRHLDYDLSEQQLLSCVWEWDCNGGWVSSGLEYIINHGIFTENCYPYVAYERVCGEGWSCNPSERVYCQGWTTIQSEEDYKRAVIKGAVAADIIQWNQGTQITGYKVLEAGDSLYIRNVDTQWIKIDPGDPLIGKTAWECKFSFGENWGDEGYMYLVGENWDLALYSLTGPAYSWEYKFGNVLCVDNDHDGYYSWGIGPKPANCPESPDEPDGDDTDPCIGSMNEYGIFKSTTPSPVTNDTMILSDQSVPDLYAAGDHIRWYSDRELTSLVQDSNWFATGQTEPGEYTYYATQTFSNCESDPNAATLSIVSEIPPPRGNDTASYAGESIMLNVTGARGAAFKWYEDPSLNTLLQAGAYFDPQVTDPGTYVYYVTQTLYEQESAPDTVILRVLSHFETSFLLALIQEGVDTNGDSRINPDEAEAVTNLNVAGYGITDMTGIENFFNLDTLYCGENNFIRLDVSSNPALKYLDCSGHLYIIVTPLQTLNLSGCTGLTHLNCSSSNLTGLELSGCTALTWLDCSYNHMTYLDLSANARLDYLNCAANPLSCLDISNNTLLGSGDGDNTKLDLGYMRSLTEVCVWTTPFPPSGMEINISGSPNLYFTENCSGCYTGREEFLHSEISVYPNPANEFVTIRSAHPEHMSVEITSSKGQLISRKEMDGTTLQLDLSSFRQGVYVITIRSKDFLITRKIVKL
jgi:hypothetical protein